MKEKIGVIVVHGIGDPAPGEALHSLTDALSNWQRKETEARLYFEPVVEKRLATQQPGKNRENLPAFAPMAMRKCTVRESNGKVEKPEMLFAEVFWGSASQLPAGTWGLLQGFVNLFFRSNTILGIASWQQTIGIGIDTRLRKVFYWFAKGVPYLLTGPIFALNLLLFLAMLVYVGLANQFQLHNPENLWKEVALSSLSGAALGIGLLAWNHRHPESMLQHLGKPAKWMLAAIVYWNILYRLTQQPQTSIIEVGTPLMYLLLTFFFLTTVGLVVMIVMRGVHWMLYEWLNPKSRLHGPPMTISLFTVIVQIGLWVSVIPTLWTILLRNFGDDALEKLYNKAVLADGLQWLVAIGIVFCLFLTWSVLQIQLRTIKKLKPGADNKAQERYRLIVNQLVMIPLSIAVLIAIGLVWIVELSKLQIIPIPTLIQTFTRPILTWLQEHPTQRVIASFAVIIIPVATVPLRLALDLVNDIINYGFNFENDHNSTLNGNGVTLKQRRPLSSDIRPRFRLVFDDLVANEGITHLVIIAHSLGSVIAIDELMNTNSTDSQAKLQCYKNKVMLITMGSPISHLYQHYFPGFYPGWDHPTHWAVLYKRLSSWQHYYRIDDYVGTVLQTFPSTAIHFKFAQLPLGEGGHTEYWQDDRFIADIYSRLVTVLEKS